MCQMPRPHPPITIHCATCGGQNIRRDASVAWDPELQMWEIVTIYDVADCDDCGGETSLVER
jgi:hypothetical protein